MAAQNETRRVAESAASPTVQKGRQDSTGDSDRVLDRRDARQAESLMQRFIHNLLAALSAWTV
jgi:hypothetical protein